MNFVFRVLYILEIGKKNQIKNFQLKIVKVPQEIKSFKETNLPIIFKSNQACNNVSRKDIYWTIGMKEILISKQMRQRLVPTKN